VGSPPLTKLDDAFAKVTTLGMDTSPFIHLVEQHPQYIDLVRRLFTNIDRGETRGMTPVITLTEVLTLPKQAGNTSLATQYRERLLNSRNLDVVQVDAAIAELAADLRARYRIRTPDALQLRVECWLRGVRHERCGPAARNRISGVHAR
jgi:predicted nucleic acid-binding protein